MSEAIIKVYLPKPPNFLRTVEGGQAIPVGCIPEEQLRDIGKAWTEALVQYAVKKRRKS